MGIDRDWFLEKIRKSRFHSQLGLVGKIRGARGMLDAAALSRLFSGERRLQFDEARQLAELLQLPLEDVLERAGMPLRKGKETTTARRLVKEALELLAGDASAEARRWRVSATRFLGD